MLKHGSSLPQDSGEVKSAEELESVIQCIAIFYQKPGKTKLDYVQKERYHNIKLSDRHIFSSSHEREISPFSCVICYLDYFFA